MGPDPALPRVPMETHPQSSQVQPEGLISDHRSEAAVKGGNEALEKTIQHLLKSEDG